MSFRINTISLWENGIYRDSPRAPVNSVNQYITVEDARGLVMPDLMLTAKKKWWMGRPLSLRVHKKQAAIKGAQKNWSIDVLVLNLSLVMLNIWDN